ncbi:N-acetylmuramoyl-L-alanine amidase [Leptospira perolatii]|uniref:N-acetylmuramoyl-L-alanine amidase n=1 Tax=Leptospira perolatii TaxID=2023191 RepID=A0A2M9ZIQ8_9LEPT|nr:N-acetylmuramoyl-L-alanine amidase [Leptospira perolatii]PJZ68161.1 N-acetylmuramoyl-L-alanine amidase [Leptospira perolatii]PJZ71939.1 N-acetylmuramoyl-L-alanine amidase [Leptospira perolatii]
MEKNQILLWLLAVSFFFYVGPILGQERIQTIGKYRYVRFKEIREKIPTLKSEFDPATMVGSILHSKGEIRFRIGSTFYTINGWIEKTSLPVLYSDKDFVIPPEVVESIFVQLLPEDVKYEFLESELVFEVSNTLEQLHISTIVIDAGHGGKDPGTSSNYGIQEKQVSLKVARALKKFLNKVYPEIQVVLTRSEDVFIELERRSELANSQLKKGGTALFLSLHCNASIAEDVNGFEVYYLSQTPSSESGRETAILENKIGGLKGRNTYKKIQAGMLSSLIQRRSRLLAHRVETEMKKNLGSKILSRGVKKADFSVLRGSLMPAILIEMGYLTHPREARLLENQATQVRIAKSVVEGIRAYELAKD